MDEDCYSRRSKISLESLSNWAKKENDNTSSRGDSLGEWIYKDNRNYPSFQEDSKLVTAKTPNAVQKNWKTPCELPCCPQESTDIPINTYAVNLRIGEIFSRNKYSHSIIFDFSLSKDKTSLLVIC